MVRSPLKEMNMLIHTRSAMMTAIILIAFFAGSQASATALTGSGSHLMLPSPPNVMPLFVTPTYTVTGTTFSGTWTAPADSAWTGTFTGTGSLPLSSAGAGTTRYDFTSLSAGSLPSNTFFTFGDVDAGSGAGERFYLKAFDASMALITTEWLSVPVATWGPTGASNPLAMPGWAWNSIAHPGAYTIDGATTASSGINPTFTFALLTAIPIRQLEVVKFTTNYAFGLAAPTLPVPETSTLILFGTGLLGLLRFGWRRERTAA
jgi:hypothetical protein